MQHSKGAIKKRFKIKKSGAIISGYSNKRHRMTRKSSRMLRGSIGTRTLSKTQSIIVRRAINAH